MKTYSLPRIKTIPTYTGLARWIMELIDEPIGYLARCQVEDIPSPYSYSPTVNIFDWNGRKVVYFETSHRRYEVFEVPAMLLRFKTDEDATAWHIRFCRKSA